MGSQVPADRCVEKFALGSGRRPFFCLSKSRFENLQWNTLQIARIVETLRQTGTPNAGEDLLARVADDHRIRIVSTNGRVRHLTLINLERAGGGFRPK